MTHILQAAIKTPEGVVWTLPRPARHPDVFVFAQEHGEPPWNVHHATQGFLASNGQFLDRKKACRIAWEAGQLRSLPIFMSYVSSSQELFTEYLW